MTRKGIFGSMVSILLNAVTSALIAVTPLGAPREAGVHPPSQELKNPIKSSDASIRAGRQVWIRECASCHGMDGRGETEMLEFLTTAPPDLTVGKYKYGKTDGEMFTVIRDGTNTDMVAFKKKIPEQRIWHVINYMKSLVEVPEGDDGAEPTEEVLENPFEMSEASVRRGRQVWVRNCSVCHGMDGRGETEMLEFLTTPPPDFTKGNFVYGDSDADLFRTTRDGTKNDMDAFGEKLTDTNIWHVVNFMRDIGPQEDEAP